MTRKQGLLTQSKSTWKSITYSLSRANNLQEGHYAERLWALMITPTDVVSSVDKELKMMPKHLNNGDPSYRGQIIAKMAAMGMSSHEDADLPTI